jgi:hypothetical protein
LLESACCCLTIVRANHRFPISLVLAGFCSQVDARSLNQQNNAGGEERHCA